MTEAQQNAALLVATGKLTIPHIAKRVGVSQRTVSKWKNDPEFLAEVRKAANAWRPKARREGVADQDARLRDLNDRYKRLRAVIHQRAKDPQMKKAPGGKTGLLCVTYKMQSLGEGRGSKAIPEYSVDTGLLTAMLAIEEHTAIEMGQWNPKTPKAGDQIISITQIMIERLHAGRQRVADEKERRDAASRSLLPGS